MPRKVGSTYAHLRKAAHHIGAALLVLATLSGCDATKRLTSDEVLLKSNRLVIDSREVSRDELMAIVKQVPNRRVLGIPFYLHMHNLPNPARIPEWRAKKNARKDRRNEKRALRGKAPKPYSPTRAEWLRENVGEAPAVLDSSLTERSIDQMRLYMTKEGWFHAEVSAAVTLKERAWFGGRLHRPKAVVTYTVRSGTPYRFRNITSRIDDEQIVALLKANEGKSFLRTGDRFDDDALEQERARITSLLRDDGFLYFTKDLIYFVADTSVGSHQVDLSVRMGRQQGAGQRGITGTPEARRYHLGEVTIATFRQQRGSSLLRADTIVAEGYRFIHPGRPLYRPKPLGHPVFLNTGELYRQRNADRTYRRLTSLGVFERVDIAYDTTRRAGEGVADTRIALLPGKHQGFSVEGFLTNRGGALGSSVNLGYKHKNLFRSLASLQIGLSVGLEAQQRIAGAEQSTSQSAVLGDGSVFNTVSLGPELTFGFPIYWRLFSKSSNARLLLNGLYNYQRRPDFTRNLGRLSVGTQWQETRSNTWGFFLEGNVVRLPRVTEAFERYLAASNNPVLRDSYTDHLITSARFTRTHATPDGEKQRNSFFARTTLEWAGPFLQAFGAAVEDSSGQRFNTVAGIRYAEYVKVDADLRWRHTLHERSSLAFRAAGGAGLPYGNLGVLPFESSFFVGGANGLRAWRARSIGPGSYSAPLTAFDRIGEIRIEGNAEYRFRLIGFLEGALFADVGNIWNFKDQKGLPGGAISERFLSELAVGAGAGARLNFDFFIVRFDLGLQTKDPSLPPGERWLFQPKDRYESSMSDLTGQKVRYTPELNFNLGIGYPF